MSIQALANIKNKLNLNQYSNNNNNHFVKNLSYMLFTLKPYVSNIYVQL